MKKKFVVLFVLFVTVSFIPFYLFAQNDIFKQEGIASWYGTEYDGRPTASGEIFDSSQLTAAHPSLPFGTMLVVTNTHNNKKVTVRVNDRGPFVSARIIDVSRAAAEQLDMIVTGTAPVAVESLDKIVISAPSSDQAVITSAVEPSVAASPVVTQPTVVDTVPAAYILQPELVQTPRQIRLTPEINIVPDKTYRLQVGSYRVARNAVDTFERLKNSGLNPAYERFTSSDNSEYFRVVLAGVRGTDVQATAQKIGSAGFLEALIREEN